MNTIPEIAKALGVTPQAIHKAKTKAEISLGYKIEGIISEQDKRKILYSEEQTELIKSFLSSSTVDKPVEKPEVTVIDGNHSASTELATIPQNYSLESFRTETVRLDLALNPSDYLQSLTTALDTVECFMAEAEIKQAERLAEIQKTNIIAKQRLNQFKERKLEHKLQTEVLAQIQNAAIGEFQATASEIQELGILQVKNQG